jgi:glucosamine--fructose-6-phosphate aminotransferase (isomerizing)
MSFASELHESPAVLRAIQQRREQGDLNAILDEIAVLTAAAAPMPILLTGMGTSYFACHYASCLLEGAGYAAVAFDTGDLLHAHPTWRERPGLKVVVSQSGRSGEILDLLALRSSTARDAWVGVTNDARSPLALAADVRVELAAGPEEMTTSKTYFATLAIMAAVAARLGGSAAAAQVALGTVADAFDAALAAPPPPEALALADAIDQGQTILFLGKAESLCAAQQAALIVQEAVHATASAATYGQWRHGPSERANPSLLIVAMPASGYDPEIERAVAESTARGAHVLRLPGADLPRWRLPFDPLIPVYRALMEIGRRRGSAVGQLSHKVTGR